MTESPTACAPPGPTGPPVASPPGDVTDPLATGSAGASVTGLDPASILDAAFRRAHIGMAITDPDGYYLEVNDTLCSLVGLSAEELLTTSFRDLVAPADTARVTAAMLDITEGRTSEFWLEHRYTTVAHGVVWARTTGIAVRDALGRLLRVIVQAEDLTTRRAIEAAQSRRDSHDQLTDLANRALFYERLATALRLPGRSVRGLGLLVINLDRFRHVNAGLGQDAGDLVLREVGQRLTAGVRGSDLVARLSSDQFAVLAFSMGAPLDVVGLAIDLRHSLARPFWLGQNAIYVSARVGVLASFGSEDDAEILVQRAEAAAELARGLAGGWALHTEGADTSSRDELALVRDLRAAIDDGELTVAYQPIVDGHGNLHHLEALARWTHPERGVVPPDQFIVLAEQNGLIAALTTRIMTSAIEQTATWRADGLPASVAINLSGKLLNDPALPEQIAAILASANLPPSALTLELTETALAEGSNTEVRTVLDLLRHTGIRVSIDDFGTGYSSLTYLKQLPVDELKIDRSFILDLHTDVRTERIVRSIIDLAHSLGLVVVAEGVEDASVGTRLQELGVDFLQGYAIARPAAATALRQWLLAHLAPSLAERRAGDSLTGMHVLVIDQDSRGRAWLQRRLRQKHHHVTYARDSTAACTRLARQMPDLVVLTDSVTGIEGMETAPRLREAGYAGPILLFSGSAPNELAAIRFPMDVWPVSSADETLLIGLIDGYAALPR